MRKHHTISGVLLACAAGAFVQGAAEQGEVPYGDNVYVNCQYRFAAQFPSPPMIRDITYTSGGRSVPARQFSSQRGTDTFVVTIADFTNGPAVDEAIVESAAAPLRARGQVRFQFAEDYDPGVPGRQLNVYLPDGRQLRASVYMADHRLYITEATASVGDFYALQFEQSISMIDANGTDLDKNVGTPSRQYICAR
jgi:hypothetical protein